MLKIIFVYLIEALAIAIAAYYIPKKVMSIADILKIAATGAIVHLLLDLYSPLVSSGLRFGTGMSLGKNMINNPVTLFGGKKKKNKGGVTEEDFTDAGDNPEELPEPEDEAEPEPVQDPSADLCGDICEADAECMTICNEAFRE